MPEQSIDQNIFPKVQGTAQCILLPEASGPRAIEHTELFPAPRGKFSVLLTAQALNNCFIT